MKWNEEKQEWELKKTEEINFSGVLTVKKKDKLRKALDAFIGETNNSIKKKRF